MHGWLFKNLKKKKLNNEDLYKQRIEKPFNLKFIFILNGIFKTKCCLLKCSQYSVPWVPSMYT